MNDVRRLLADNRLVTLTGAGGVLRGTQNEYESVTFGEDEHR